MNVLSRRGYDGMLYEHPKDPLKKTENGRRFLLIKKKDKRAIYNHNETPFTLHHASDLGRAHVGEVLDRGGSIWTSGDSSLTVTLSMGE